MFISPPNFRKLSFLREDRILPEYWANTASGDLVFTRLYDLTEILHSNAISSFPTELILLIATGAVNHLEKWIRFNVNQASMKRW